jgi:Excalibur calcium-binding domain
MKRMLLVLAAASVAVSVTAASAEPAQLVAARTEATVQAPTASFRNCTALNRVYRHGVGKYGARDHTRSGDPVTNFKRSNSLYRQNSGLDRDKDGIACEKK